MVVKNSIIASNRIHKQHKSKVLYRKEQFHEVHAVESANEEWLSLSKFLEDVTPSREKRDFFKTYKLKWWALSLFPLPIATLYIQYHEVTLDPVWRYLKILVLCVLHLQPVGVWAGGYAHGINTMILKFPSSPAAEPSWGSWQVQTLPYRTHKSFPMFCYNPFNYISFVVRLRDKCGYFVSFYWQWWG